MFAWPSARPARRPAALLLLFLAAALLGRSPAAAQTPAPLYWRYDAPGRINAVSVADLNDDGIDELVVVAGDTNVAALDAGGRPLWETPLQFGQPVVQILPIAAGDGDAGAALVVATRDALLLVGHDREILWSAGLETPPAAITAYSASAEAVPDGILLALQDGRLLRYGLDGQLAQEYDLPAQPAAGDFGRLAVADLNRDGRNEIVYSYFTREGSSTLMVLDASGDLQWSQSDRGQVSALTIAEFDDQGPLEIALSTSLDRVYLYTWDGQRRWPYRSPNRHVTALEMARLQDRPVLLVATDGGTVVAYDRRGRRLWSNHYDPDAARPILSLSVPPSGIVDDSRIGLAVTLGQAAGSIESADVFLLDDQGRRLEPAYPAADVVGLSRLTDLNHDGRSELLLASFATMELLDPGIGTRQYSETWKYRLVAEPAALLITDIDLDGTRETLLGTSDGNLHAVRRDGSRLWVTDLGGVIALLDVVRSSPESLPDLVAAHNDITVDQNGVETVGGILEVLRPDGRSIWRQTFSTAITAHLVADINQTGRPEIIVGTSDGQIAAYSLTGEEFWRTDVPGSINYLTYAESDAGAEIVAGTGANTIERLNIKGAVVGRIAGFLQEITYLVALTAGDDEVPALLATLDDGTVRSFNRRGAQIWETSVNGRPNLGALADDSLLIATDEQELYRIGLDGAVLWRAADLGRITALLWGDLDGDARPDIAVGNREGQVTLIASDGVSVWHSIELESEVAQVAMLEQAAGQPAELVVVTDNGVAQLFQSQVNGPPLLYAPETEVESGRYSVSISVKDAESEPVTVALELYDPGREQWLSAGEKVARTGNETLLWPITPPDELAVRYRFVYDDGAHRGVVEPSAGPAPIVAGPFGGSSLAAGVIAAGILLTAFFALRQSRSPAAPARRLRRRLQQQPSQVLSLIEAQYRQTRGSPDFLLNVAGQARQEQQSALASLADGLYLLNVRPEAASPIILAALDEARTDQLGWVGLDDWQTRYALGQALLNAPSITELSLLRLRLDQFVQNRPTQDGHYPAYNSLLQVLGVLRDSERVDLGDDRLLYLNEAASLLEQLKLRRTQLFTPEEALIAAIADRWLGLVRAEIEDLHGRAQLAATLVTRHVLPGVDTVVALELHNAGRAAAENIVVELEPDPAFLLNGPAPAVPYLAPGRKRQVQVTLEPQVTDRFRIVFNITYDDRTGEGRQVAYADMVDLLYPARDFRPIANPYSPGMPLRRNSLVFFGRDELFQFIAENAGAAAQPNVLILVGQRRTGKTSALLRLEEHLPAFLLPVYIDCQSLGVVPGMPAFFHDLAWIIADAMEGHGYPLEVPDLDSWRDDPAGKFDRDFLAAALGALPADSRLLLVFDEFEAFEDLVEDGVLPRTLFTYLRHLMQHAQRLSFIFAGTHRLEEMGSDYWSVLFNIALYRQIGFLDEQAARRLILKPVEPNLIYDDLAVDKMLRVTAGHPYFLQLVCYTLVSRANQLKTAYITISDVNAALDEMLRLGEVHFAYLWQHSSFGEKALLAAASRISELEAPFRPADLVQYLAQYSIYLEPPDVVAALNRLVEREIFRELTDEGTSLYEIRIGLVALWVARNKSLARLHEGRAGVTTPARPPA